MQSNFHRLTGSFQLNRWYLYVGLFLIAVLLGMSIAVGGFKIGIVLVIIPFGIIFLTLLVIKPRFALWSYLFYIFVMNGVIRHVSGVPLGLLMEFILVLAWAGYFFQKFRKFNFKGLSFDMGVMITIWIIINVLEFFNPVGPSPAGWFYEARTAFMAWMFITPLATIILNKRQDFNKFMNIIIWMSFAGFLYAFKQIQIGVDGKEQQWLDAGAHTTHVLWGKLRAFSFYSDAGQFGVSQAHISLVAGIMALGPYAWRKKIIYGVVALCIFYGMLIAGTRSAIAVPAVGILVFLIMSKQVKIMVIGGLFAGTAFYTLKYTDFMEGNAEIRRLRTALDPEDRSFQTRLRNQEKLADWLSTHPFGAGVGTIGEWGETYNEHLVVAHIPPDSLLVKQWAMYGIVGFLIWFCFMLYIIGKGIGYAWSIRDPDLKQKVTALTAGHSGILFASLGQEAMNLMPTMAIITFGWAFIFLSPKFDKEYSEKLKVES